MGRRAVPELILDEQCRKRLAQVLEMKPSKAGIYRKVYAGKASPREAIKAFCLECIGWEVEEIRNCCITACALWRLRPYQQKRTGRGGGRDGVSAS